MPRFGGPPPHGGPRRPHGGPPRMRRPHMPPPPPPHRGWGHRPYPRGGCLCTLLLGAGSVVILLTALLCIIL